MQLINADIIYDTAIVTSQLFRKSFNCRYNPRMDYVPCLTLQSYEKWRSPLFGATGNFNHQILLYGILFLTFKHKVTFSTLFMIHLEIPHTFLTCNNSIKHVVPEITAVRKHNWSRIYAEFPNES